MKYIKKHWYIIVVLLLVIVRFLISYKLPNFYIHGMAYDDNLMLSQFKSIVNGDYLGNYNNTTLIKGFVYPYVLALSDILKINFNTFLTILYILSCIYFVRSLKNIVDNKYALLIVFIVILFNPISYSSDLFQRLYRNSLSVIELLFFLGTIIRIMTNKKNNIFNYVLLGIILSFMYLTREDNIWTLPIIGLVFIYKLYKNIHIKNILINLIPVFILVLSLNVVSYINYRHYGVYTYNEIKKSSFKDAYINILRIKEDKKYDNVAINKKTFYKIIDNSDILGFDKDYLDKQYKNIKDKYGEVDNGNIVWYFRNWIYNTHNFKNGKEANKYFKELDKEIDRLFKENKLEQEKIIPSVLINTPTTKDLKQFPKSILNAVLYTTTYKNVMTFSDIRNNTNIVAYIYDYDLDVYGIIYYDYRNTDVMPGSNDIKYESIRVVYEYLTIIFSIVALVVYVLNIKKLDVLNIFIHFILISYMIIILGVSYTDATAYHAIRYMYLGNTYILQSIFILLNLYRLYLNKYTKKKDNNSKKKKTKK